ncbi:hypothetical protein KFK09_011964 [Dendrobium nobile]|uniref:Uncharacterized protein n=1 Tax=Dendrobium nobile TaxID=94219 RepID=A0A8T3BHH7_DENNO|nr:hypothetical protein KFK09_011964 [Dendrobium nobile]
MHLLTITRSLTFSISFSIGRILYLYSSLNKDIIISTFYVTKPSKAALSLILFAIRDTLTFSRICSFHILSLSVKLLIHFRITMKHRWSLWALKVCAPNSPWALSFSHRREEFLLLSSQANFQRADWVLNKILPRDFALILRGLHDLSSGFL